MKKTNKIQARCTDQLKDKLSQAASYKGVSETDFILTAVEKEIKKYNITFNKLLVGGKLSQKEITKIDQIKGLTRMKGRHNETSWFNKEAEIALQINEDNEVMKGYLTNKNNF